MAFDIFICYESTTGKSFAENLKKALERDGKNAFLASTSLLTSDLWRKRINIALEEAPVFIIIITALTISSFEVKKEYEKAMKMKKYIVPCRYCDIPTIDTLELAQFHQIEFEDKHDLANKAILGIRKLNGGINNGV